LENYFEAGFLGVKVCDVFASRQPLEKSPTLTPQKSHRKKIYKTKPALPNNFSLGPKGAFEIFEVFVS
jgi:hypothetical protein